MSRFDELKAQLAAKGATDPDGLARYIGEHKYGHPGFAALQAAGQAKKKAMHDSEAGNRVAVQADPMLPRMLEAARLVAQLPILPL
jgi:hypothetical protein